MKIKPCLLLLFCSLSFTVTFAQSDSLRIKTYRNEIGADFRPIVRVSPSAGLIYRRHQEKAAWRLRLNGEFSSRNVLRGAESVNLLETDLRWGREWHLLYKKFCFYYGLDVLTSYRFDRYSSSTNPLVHRQHYATAGLLPLIGCTYVLDERFSVSVETNGRYSTTMTFEGGRHFNDSRGIFIAAHALFLSYRF